MCNEIYVEILEDKQSDQISLLRQHITTTVTTQILILTGTEGGRGPCGFVYFSTVVVAGDLQTTIKTGYTCEGEELFIQCAEEETIQIVRANYGRFSIAICNEEGKTHWSVNCMSPKTRHILQNR